MKTFLILLLALLLLSGCQGSTSVNKNVTCTQVTNSLYRCIDKEYGYICYAYSGIWCGKLAQ